MHAARLILIAVAAGTFVPEAQAVNYVWWEASPRNADSSVVNMGLGQNLDLECALNAARCEWSVSMFLKSDETLFLWATDLIPDDPTLHVTSFQYETWIGGSSPYFYPFDSPRANTTVNGGVHFGGAQCFAGVGPSAASYYPNGYLLFSFVLSKDKGANWVPGWSNFTTLTNGIEWAPPYEMWVQYGANPVINAAPHGTTGGPVISVFNVPEPASAALVGVAVFCLAWRVRGRVSRRGRLG